MTRGAEARFWQAIGAITAFGGGILLAYDFEKYGLAPIDPRALAIGIGSSFVLLVGGACYLAGRSLHVGETQLTPTEGRLWTILAAVCLIAGSAVVVAAWRQHSDLFLDRLTMALAGSFSIMFGVLCLLGERVMRRMHDVLVGEESKSAVSGQ